MENLIIRPETPEDYLTIHHIHLEAFGRDEEAELVDNLRNDGALVVSYVAEIDEQVVGHVAYSLMDIDHPDDPATILGLGPMAVSPEFQKQGIGRQLLIQSLEACTRARYSAVIVLGHPEFYAKGDFIPASEFGINSQFDVPDEVFMARELIPGTLNEINGTARYHPAFDGV